MIKTKLMTVLSFVILLTLGGCSSIGSKTSSIAVIYGVTTILSTLLLIGYCSLVKKKEIWFITLFSSVFIVNAGYFSLSISKTLEEALLANRISYLGSAILPLAMLMIIKNSCGIKFPKIFTALLVTTSIVVFLIAASPGYLDIYYKSVTLETTNGITVLNKEYGSWHRVYLFYLLGYFGAMIATIAYSVINKKIRNTLHAFVLISAVFINIGVWLLEQLVRIDFEILSVSYIITELFLITHYLMIQENEQLNYKADNKNQPPNDNQIVDNTLLEKNENYNTEHKKQSNTYKPEHNEQYAYFKKQLDTLTATEKSVYYLHIQKKTTKEILEQLNIKENTLKYHNRNIYSKLGVSSKKELCIIASAIDQADDQIQ